MVVITVEAHKNAGVDAIAVENEEYYWVKMIDVQNGLGVKNISHLLIHEIKSIYETSKLTIEQRKKFIKTKTEINKGLKDVFYFKYSRNDITEKIIKNCRGVKRCKDGVNRMEKVNQRDNFRILLEFKENDIFPRKEYSITLKIKKIFPNEVITDQYKVNKYFIDLVFPVHKLGIEIDESGHTDRSKIEEQKRQKIMKEETGFEIIRINPDKENFDIFDEIGKIETFISNSNKKLTEELRKNKMIDDTEKLTKMLKLL